MADEPPRLAELDRDECLRLLAGASLGRVAVNVPDWPPMIRPVNYIFDGPSQSVIFRSARGSKLHALTHAARAAFDAMAAWLVEAAPLPASVGPPS